MKLLLATALVTSFCLPAHAELFSRSSVNGAAVGAVAGAIIGNNSGHGNGARGAAIGAGAGFLLGSMQESRGDHRRGPSVHSYPVRHPSHYSPGYSHHYRPHYRSGVWYSPRPVVYVAPRPVYYGPSYYTPSYYSSGYYGSGSYYSRPSYASSGLLWGGLAGAIIGNNSGRGNGLRGAAIGAGAGLLLGSILDNDRPAYETVERPAEVVYNTTPAPSTQAPAPQNVTIINNYYNAPSTPMSSANSLFGR